MMKPRLTRVPAAVRIASIATPERRASGAIFAPLLGEQTQDVGAVAQGGTSILLALEREGLEHLGEKGWEREWLLRGRGRPLPRLADVATVELGQELRKVEPELVSQQLQCHPELSDLLGAEPLAPARLDRVGQSSPQLLLLTPRLGRDDEQIAFRWRLALIAWTRPNGHVTPAAHPIQLRPGAGTPLQRGDGQALLAEHAHEVRPLAQRDRIRGSALTSVARRPMRHLGLPCVIELDGERDERLGEQRRERQTLCYAWP
jgi:hypothetical protein